jgi:DNA-binding transcriptional ArsR family regulator
MTAAGQGDSKKQIPMLTAPPSRPDLSDANIERVYGLVSFIANRHLFDHMRRLVVVLELDLESVFIWGTLAQLNVASALRPGIDPLKVLESDGHVPESALRAVRLSHLAQISGMPRETVRRKLEALRERGKVERNSQGYWQVTMAGVDAQTRAFTVETVRRLISASDHIGRVLDLAADPGA